MLVKEIVELTKSRSRVYTEEDVPFVVYKGELRKYHIEKGKPIAEEDYEELMKKVLPKRAKLRSMNLLQTKEYTEKQLRDKLLQGGYPEKVADEALEYVKSYHYIDDERYAMAYIEYQIDKRSRQRIIQDLLKKGISRDCIERQWQHVEALGVEADEEKMIAALLEKKHYSKATADMKEKRRIFAYLMRKGFATEKIKRALNAEEWE